MFMKISKCIPWLILSVILCVNCSNVKCWKQQSISDPQSKRLGVIPAEPGIFVEDSALAMLDSCVWRYLKEKTVFSDVRFINATRSEMTQVVDIVNRKEDVFQFKIPDDALVNQYDVLLAISNVRFSSDGYGDKINIVVPIPIPFFPIIPLVNFGTVKISDYGTIANLKCSYDFLLWDTKSRTKIAYGSIDGRFDKAGYFKNTMSDSTGQIAVFDKMIQMLTIARTNYSGN
jgi:hypothetical protein